MIDTQETDAAWACFKGYMEPLQDVKDLSCKLERERDKAHKNAERAIDDLAWFNETNAQRLQNELDQIKGGAK